MDQNTDNKVINHKLKYAVRKSANRPRTRLLPANATIIEAEAFLRNSSTHVLARWKLCWLVIS